MVKDLHSHRYRYIALSRRAFWIVLLKDDGFMIEISTKSFVFKVPKRRNICRNIIHCNIMIIMMKLDSDDDAR